MLWNVSSGLSAFQTCKHARLCWWFASCLRSTAPGSCERAMFFDAPSGPHLQKLKTEICFETLPSFIFHAIKPSLWGVPRELASQTNLFQIWLGECRKNCSDFCRLNLSRHDGGTGITMDTEPALSPGERPVITSLCRLCGNLRQHHYPSQLGAGISSSGCFHKEVCVCNMHVAGMH